MRAALSRARGRWRALALAAVVLAAGCGGDGDEPAGSGEGASAGGEAAASERPTGRDADGSSARDSHYPVTIDNCGREVTFEQRPERVVILDGGSISETTSMVALGLDEVIVASAQQRQARSERDDLVEAVAAVPAGNLERGGGDGSEVVASAILAAEPDLVIAPTSDAFSTVASPEASGITRDELAEAGAETYVTPTYCESGAYSGAGSLDLYASYELLDDLGRIFNAQAEAAALVYEQTEALDELAAAVAGAGQEPARIALLDTTPAAASATENGVAAVLTDPAYNAVLGAAGGVNAFDNLFVTNDEMAAADVDLVVIAAATGPTDPDERIEVVWDSFNQWAATSDEAWTWVSDGLEAGPTQHLAVSKIAAAANPNLAP